MSRFYVQYFSTIPHHETTYNDRVRLFARVWSYHPPRTKTHRHRISNGRTRPEGFSPPRTKRWLKAYSCRPWLYVAADGFPRLYFYGPGYEQHPRGIYSLLFRPLPSICACGCDTRSLFTYASPCQDRIRSDNKLVGLREKF